MERKEITPWVAVSPGLLYVLGGLVAAVFAVVVLTNFSDIVRYLKIRQM
jgi:hypothetical protein